MLNRDPIATQTRQPYAYANNDLTDQTDPTGLYGIRDFANDVTGSVGEVDDVMRNAQSAQFLGNEILGAADTLSFGSSNSLLGINGDCLGVAGDIGGALGLAVPGALALKSREGSKLPYHDWGNCSLTRRDRLGAGTERQAKLSSRSSSAGAGKKSGTLSTR